MNEFIKTTKSAIILIALNIGIFFLGINTINPYAIPVAIIGAIIYFHNRHLMGRTWSIKVEEKKKLITKGLFKHVRHPLYLGVIITCIGFILATENYLLLLILVFLDIPYTYKRAILEEEILTKKLKGYKEYKKKTGMFIPRIKQHNP